jgi:hypothetical protein
LQNVRGKKIYCPTCDTLITRPCINPPGIFKVLSELRKACEKHRKKFPVKDKKLPDRAWLLSCLSSLEPEHKYFQPTYFPSPEASVLSDSFERIEDL